MTANDEDMTKWVQLAQIQLDLASSNRSVYEMTDIERSNLENIYNESSMGDESRIMAEIMLAELGHRQATFIPLVPHINETRTARTGQESEKEIRLWPNPAHSYFELQYPLSEESYGIIILKDALGKNVIQKQLYSGSEKHLVEINELQSGAYLVELLINGNLVFTQKLIVQ